MSFSIALLVLAAGASVRMGPRNKLLLPVGGVSMLERAVRAAVESAAGEVFVVTGADDYAGVLDRYPVERVFNPDHEEGMASSIRAGVQAAGPHVDAYGILLGDMPFLRPETIGRITRHVRPETIVVPCFDGTSGHPVLFARSYRRDLLELRGDVGARSVVRAHAANVVTIEAGDPGILRDVDTEEAYRRAEGPLGGDPPESR